MKPTCRIFVFVFLGLLLGVNLPAAVAQFTTPEEYFGYKPGADFHLMTYETAIGYFEELAGETDRMIVLDMGETSFGRRMKYAVISSEDNMAQLERYKDINKRLTLADGLSDREAQRFADQGRTIVWIDGGLHASECARRSCCRSWCMTWWPTMIGGRNRFGKM